jgi:hypothetical protein
MAVTCTCPLYMPHGPPDAIRLVYEAVAGCATMTLRVLLRASRCCRRADYAQEGCSTLGFMAGLRNDRMREHLANSLRTDEAHGTVHMGNGHMIFTAAIRDRLRSLAASPALSVSAETCKLCVDMLRWGHNAVGCVACGPADTAAGKQRTQHRRLMIDASATAELS